MALYEEPVDEDVEIDNTKDNPDNPIYASEPPVPPGLKKLSPPLQNFVQVFGIDPFLVQAGAEASPDPQKALVIEYRELIGPLPQAECDDLRTRLAEGDPGVGLALRKRLSVFQPQERPQQVKPRIIQQLLRRTELLRKLKSSARPKSPARNTSPR